MPYRPAGNWISAAHSFSKPARQYKKRPFILLQCPRHIIVSSQRATVTKSRSGAWKRMGSIAKNPRIPAPHAPPGPRLRYDFAMPLHDFHPAVAAWFRRQFARATDVQAQAWPAIRRHQHTLIAAPTGSGKTLAAFLAAIDELVREGLERPLPDETRVLYISPLKALSNDIQKNLSLPLAGIRDELLMQQLPDVDIRTVVRTGDTPAGERTRMRRPESELSRMNSDSGV